MGLLAAFAAAERVFHPAAREVADGLDSLAGNTRLFYLEGAAAAAGVLSGLVGNLVTLALGGRAAAWLFTRNTVRSWRLLRRRGAEAPATPAAKRFQPRRGTFFPSNLAS